MAPINPVAKVARGSQHTHPPSPSQPPFRRFSATGGAARRSHRAQSAKRRRMHPSGTSGIEFEAAPGPA
eukprot:5517624-Alexandrium_andersonii.AAC.1